MKTNLQKILSISGQPGLFEYVSQANAGVIVESLLTKKRAMYGVSARMTSLSDISIYTTEEEVPLYKVFNSMHEKLQDNNAPEAKSDPEVLRKFFAEALPDYDKDKFYVSHMKKVVDWYNTLKQYASLDFELPEEK